MSFRKNEILSTISEAYLKLTNSKLKFSIVQDNSLKPYVTSKKQKGENPEFTLMKNAVNYIEDIIPEEISEEKEEIETTTEDEDKQKLENNENEGDNLGKNMDKMGEKDKFDYNLDNYKNPFTKVLIRGGIAAGTGAGAAVGGAAAFIAFDSFLVTSALTALGGMAVTGIGLIIAVPSLIGFGAYKIYKNVRDKDKKKFFDSFNLEKMEIEKEFQKYVICKIDNYFNKKIIIENNDELEMYINNIIDIYISIDKEIIESEQKLKKNQILNKIKKDGKIVAFNISKIRQELMKTILGSGEKKVENILEQGIPLYKEFIKNFGPIKIDKDKEKEIDKNISKIIDIMKEILEKKMKVAFNKFDTKLFIKSFDLKIEELYEEKKKLDDISQKDFTSNCKDFIIEPIANNSQNYGVLSLFFKFTLVIQKICAQKKADNFNKMKEKIINQNQSNNQNNTFGYCPTFNQNLNQNMYQNLVYQQNQNQMIQQMNMMQGMMGQYFPFNQNMDNAPAPLNQVMVEKPKPLNKEKMDNINENLNQNQYINIEFILKNNKIIIQGELNMTAEELIQKFKIKLCDNNIIINKYLINDETELNPNDKKTLKELGITSDTKIMVS